MICPKSLHKTLKILKFNPEAEMFASNTNYQFHTHSLKFYAFPPFSVISRTLKKIKAGKAEGILVVPYWSNQIWFPVLFKMLVDIAVLITSRKNLLKLLKTSENLFGPGAPHVEGNIYSSLSLDRFIVESNGLSKQT